MTYSFESFWRLPFNWRTPFGYLLAMISEGVGIIYTLHTVATIICYMAASCRSFVAILKDIENDVPLLSVGGMSDHSHMLTEKRLCKIIQLYSDLKQLGQIHPYILIGVPYWKKQFEFNLADLLTSSMRFISS